MKKIITTVLCFALAGAFVSCGDGEISSSRVSSLSGIIDEMPTDGDSYTLKLTVYDEDSEEYVPLASASVSDDGSFEMDLPKSVSSSYLYRFADDAPKSISFSNKNVKVVEADLELWSGEDYLDDVYYYSDSAEGELTYADGDFTATGSFDGVTINMALKKGWNWTFFVDDEDSESITTTRPAGMKFYFDGEY